MQIRISIIKKDKTAGDDYIVTMQVKILFDNEGIDKKYSVGWGFSCLINEKILFDTGKQASFLLDNLSAMGIDKSTIEAVVISHDHWDHTGGLWGLLSNSPGLKVYACPHFSQTFKDKVAAFKGTVIECDTVTQITDDIYCTGEIIGDYKGQKISEQAIIVRTGKGISVVSGCAHPGIIKIVENVKDYFISERIYMVFGGFHLSQKTGREIRFILERFEELEVLKVGPTHCSGIKAEELFKAAYAKNFVDSKVGGIIEV